MFYSRKWRERIWRYAPLVFWIGIIFAASSNSGSMSSTSRFVRPVLEFLFPTLNEDQLLVIHVFLRKMAHIICYAILGLLAARAFSATSIHTLRRIWFLVALALTILVAAIDEINQSFLASRTGTIRDVLLDASSGLLAITLFALLFRRKIYSVKS